MDNPDEVTLKEELHKIFIQSVVPCSVEHLPDVEEDSTRVTPLILVVRDVIDNMTKLMAAAMSPSEAKFEIRGKIISFSKLLQSLEDVVPSEVDD